MVRREATITESKYAVLRLAFSCLALLLCIISADVLAAQKIRRILIEGTERVETSTVGAYLRVKPGDEYNSVLVDESLRALYETGLFSDVNINLDGSDLIVVVQENPIINQIAFEGNKRINDETLGQEVRLQPRSVLSNTAVQNDVDRILAIYRKGGRFLATVEPKIIRLPQNRVDLVFEIKEGEKTLVDRIYFVGNKFFSSSKLREVLQTSESAWYNILTANDTYDPDRLEVDKEMLRRYYLKNGFADFKVLSVVTELTPERDAFFVTFTIEEGERYTFGDMTVQAGLEKVNRDELLSQLLTQKGETYNAELIDKSQEALIDYLGTQGYAFVDIEPRFIRDDAKKSIGISYEIAEGPRVYVDKINITGNVRTEDRVIRREFRLAEGDPYNSTKLRRTKQRIENLGFFEKVDMNNVRRSEPDRVDVDLDVKEKSTGELTLGAGFSTADGALADIGITERNLLGNGQSLRLNTTIAQQRQQFDIGFTEPYFLDREIAAGFDLFKLRRDRQRESSFDSDSVGLVARATYALTEHLSHAVRYSIRSDDIRNVDIDASRFIRDQEGKTTTSLVGHSLIYDTRDNNFNPSEGYIIRYNQDVAGLGGDAKYFLNELRTAYFIPVVDQDVVLSLSAKGGYIMGIGDENVRINNRFFVGGNDLRGFEPDGIGPRDRLTKDALGGNIYYAGSVEMRFPLGLPEELGISGAAFSDFGSLWEVDDTGPEVEDDDMTRISAGVGLAWASPFGPIRIDFANAIRKNEYDEEEFVRFNFGTRF